MTRPTWMRVNPAALLHNLRRVNASAPQSRVLAMVKANAYGCGIENVVPVLEGQVDGFGVAALDEACAIRALGARTPCVLMGGVFDAEEWRSVNRLDCISMVHSHEQLALMLQTPLTTPASVWVKVNTGMQRLGFLPEDVPGVLAALNASSWIAKNPCVITHFARADEPDHGANRQQLATFATLNAHAGMVSIANSAAILSGLGTTADWVRPGIMLYGVSPFSGTTAKDVGLRPVVSLMSAITAIHDIAAGQPVGYGHAWVASRPSRIGIIPIGYGDGYPRHVGKDASVAVNGQEVPVVGRVSMDMLTVDLTDSVDVCTGDAVELWGEHMPIERIAHSAGTIGYELLCQLTDRVRHSRHTG
ncbi:alanine racemase [Legionella geestiana]|uniref:alanine racemase n=1 Tax=Legionella geestiana TaxID=45065 RepID=UPI0010921491|nr:alanine racemase [Legionella geestiana]QDQ39261.1 alanine racemase [Legionella geestiana]